MNTATIHGVVVTVWTKRDLEGLTAERRRLAVTLLSECHPVQTLDNNPEKLRAEYHADVELLVLHCGVCGKPVHAVEVA